MNDIKKITQVHEDAFPDFFLTSLGSGFLQQYYRLFLEAEHYLFVAENENGEMSGFVAGTSNSEMFYQTLTRRFYLYISPLAREILLKGRWREIVKKIKNVILHDSVNEKIVGPIDYSELTSIAVSPLYQGKSVGKALLRFFCESVKISKISKGVYLTTDDENNEKIKDFYERYGFSLYSRFSQSESRKMLMYIYKF